YRVAVGFAGFQAGDGGGRPGDGGDDGAAFVDAVPGDGARARAPAQGDGIRRDGTDLRGGRSTGRAGGGAAGSVEDAVVGVVGAGAVPAVEVELGGGLVAGGEGEGQLVVGARVAGPGGGTAGDAEVDGVPAHPGGGGVGGVRLHGHGLRALGVVGADGGGGE